MTLAFVGHAAGDDELAAVQRDAYRAFRAHVARFAAAVDGGSADAAATIERTEQLIAQVDGIALQALFDPASWSPARQLAALDALLDHSA